MNAMPDRALRDDPAAAPSTAELEVRLATALASSPVPSPCVNICRMDAAGRLCLGCRRTLDEIAAWSRLDDAARRAVWQALTTRRPLP
jgi:predicted Fe-S protein YdhL (DUF1289 family)